jgi:hypothetical protein
LRNQTGAYPARAVMTMQQQPELVADPVGHISISGVHGRDELRQRLAHAPRQPQRYEEQESALKPILIGAAIGAALMYLLKR